MKCDLCGSEKAKIRYISRSYGNNEEIFIIENIPLISCPDCGESYFTAETMRKIEAIKQLRNSSTITRNIPVAKFAS
ncbi:type II toxin-antitoxin system MqsA family antitoxin [Cyanobacterium sp. Dongsha4]|uniref:type II toxin-antitoxin system MqsA family antitoxin n=1 Tax=Cyanobacterium sp. DS4 TaxID=2878255 RepID=UPI002E8030A7|nr:type II toxin-antitoxin system MqsA family antitoxin [Cyanobacterium sp. Dongsha4]WVL01726.1 type II toxin-antitoxin system MqsA family antitoxin [Cyanobacterium sp. Dongsha4]